MSSDCVQSISENACVAPCVPGMLTTQYTFAITVLNKVLRSEKKIHMEVFFYGTNLRGMDFFSSDLL